MFACSNSCVRITHTHTQTHTHYSLSLYSTVVGDSAGRPLLSVAETHIGPEAAAAQNELTEASNILSYASKVCTYICS